MKGASTKGIALINALIVVAAISSISVALLVRAEDSRQRSALNQHLFQTDRYLDATELLVRTTLDHLDPELIYLGQDWARERINEPIDMGSTGWLVQDLQGRFNINWMISDDDEAARAGAAFYRLLQAEGFASDQVELLMEAFSPVGKGREAPSRSGGGWDTIRYPALPLRSVRELGLIAGIDEADVVRLEQVAAALPRETALNINTVVPSVLVALFPETSLSFLTELQKRQEEDPFEDIGSFLEMTETFMEDQKVDSFFIPGMSTSSDWFWAEISADLGAVSRNRTLILHRSIEDSRTAVMVSIAEVLRQR